MRSRDMLVSMYQMAPKDRVKRGWLFGQWVPDGGAGGGADYAGAPEVSLNAYSTLDGILMLCFLY